MASDARDPDGEVAPERRSIAGDARPDAAESAKEPAMERDAPVQPAAHVARDSGSLRPQPLDAEAVEAPPEDVILRARGVVKHFGGLKAVDGMDVDVKRGELVGLIGPNGAGKSTFFNCLTGYVEEDAGLVWFNGERVDPLPMHKVARRGLVRTFQLARPLQRLTVRENLMLAPKGQSGEGLLGAFRFWKTRSEEERVREQADEALEFFQLAHLSDEFAGALSGGQKKLLDLARVYMLEPSMMLLDEPMAGVNPTLGRRIMERIVTLQREKGLTFLLVEHDMETVFNYCERVVVMAEGRKLAEGTPREIQENREVQEAYLGG